MLRVSSLRRLLPAARIPDLSCGRLIGRWPSRLCTTQTDTRSAAEEPFAEPPPEHEPFAEASPVEDDDRPIRLPPEMRPPGDTSRKYVKVDEQGRAFAIGRRKQASARVWVWPVAEEQPAEVSINGMDIGRWFGGHWDYRVVLLTPFFVTVTPTPCCFPFLLTDTKIEKHCATGAKSPTGANFSRFSIREKIIDQ